MLSVGVRDLEEPGFLNLVDLRPEYFQAFVDALRLRFGSWDGYVIEGLEMTKEDLDTIKANLRS